MHGVEVHQPREVVVRADSSHRETLILVLTIVLLASLMALRFLAVNEAGGEVQLHPYQRIDNIFSKEERTMYRTLTASISEVVALRNREGLWPEAALLEDEEIPPFNNQFLPPTLRGYTWVGYDGGSWIDYLGQDETGTQKLTFILRLIDLHAGYHPHPHPGIDYDPKLPVATQVWFFPEPERAYPGERLPEAGWLWAVRPDDPVLRRASTVAPDAKANTEDVEAIFRDAEQAFEAMFPEKPN